MFSQAAGSLVVYALSSPPYSIVWSYVIKPVGSTLLRKSWDFVSYVIHGPKPQEQSVLEKLQKDNTGFDIFEVIEETNSEGVLTRYVLLERTEKITYNEPVYL